MQLLYAFVRTVIRIKQALKTVSSFQSFEKTSFVSVMDIKLHKPPPKSKMSLTDHLFYNITKGSIYPGLRFLNQAQTQSRDRNTHCQLLICRYHITEALVDRYHMALPHNLI